ncbi:MAG: hypothetical protein Kow00120_06630 [Anaerolineae bacterium]
MVDYTGEEARLARLLRRVALAAALLAIVALVGAYFGPTAAFFTQPPFVSNSVAALGLLALLAWFAAADVRRFRALAVILAGSLGLGAAVFILLIFSPNGPAQQAPLLIGAVVCAALAVAVAWALMQARPAAPAWQPWMTDKPLTRAEQVGRAVSVVVGLASVVGVAAHIVFSFTGPAEVVAFFTQPLMVGGSAVKIGALAACLLLAAWDIRRRQEMLTVFILANAVSLVAVLVTHLGINRFGATAVVLGGATTTTRDIMLGALLLDGSVIALFALLLAAMNRALLDHVVYFTPLQFRALEAVSETLIEGGASETTPPYQIALRADGYLGSFASRRIWVSRIAVMGVDFLPLLWLQPPLRFQNPALRRDFIDLHFKHEVVNARGLYALLERHAPDLIDIIEAGMRFNMQMTYLGYYGDPRVQAAIGYTPFSERPEGRKAKPIRRHPPLNVTTPEDLRRVGTDTISSADVVVIGSGAAGAVLAHQLAAQGRDVLVLEKGLYVPPDDFSEDEVDMISRLYREGAFQISQSLRFTILQGSCVGGTTVVNNAVCFDTPERVLRRWNDPAGANAGIDETAYCASQQAVRDLLSVKSIKDSTKTRPWEDVLNPGDRFISKGVAAYLKDQPHEYDVIEANIVDCLGCGYCNIGCRYGRKLSMLDTLLPEAQQAHGARFRILSEAEAVRLNGEGGVVREIVVRLGGRRELRIRNPKTVIVSAGTVASSWLLMQSGVGKGALPVGRGISFNMGSPLHGYFGEKIDSYAGLQIAHYLALKDHPEFVYETWYNPPIAQALTMPGWLDTHFRNMQHYDQMAAVGVLVGTEPVAYLKPSTLFRGMPDVVYRPTARDLDALVEALVILGRILFAAGALEVYASTRKHRSYTSGRALYTSEGDLDHLRDLVKDDRDILLGTGHPQGGNAISKVRGVDGARGGVVAPDFRVHGFSNLYVCDASVFPSATTVNPQLSVMTMAHYAAGLIQ